METRPWCKTCKCIIHVMGKTIYLCFSTFQPDGNLSAKNWAGPSYGSNPSPLLADTTLVYNAPSPINRQPSVPSSAKPSLNTIMTSAGLDTHYTRCSYFKGILCSNPRNPENLWLVIIKMLWQVLWQTCRILHICFCYSQAWLVLQLDLLANVCLCC